MIKNYKDLLGHGYWNRLMTETSETSDIKFHFKISETFHLLFNEIKAQIDEVRLTMFFCCCRNWDGRGASFHNGH